MTVNLVNDLLKYSDEEVIEYLESVMGSVMKNHRAALETKQPEIIWASYGDVSLVYNVLKAMKKRNDLRKAQQP